MEISNQTANRLASLDVLRGIAVLMVLCLHTPVPQFWKGISENNYFAQIFNRIITLGSCGVDLFFVLSGFLISGLLFHEQNKTGKIHFSNFWIRRAFKIFPAYYTAYGLAFIVSSLLLAYKSKDGIISVISNRLAVEYPNLIFLQTYINSEHRWIASWSLAVEEHFYLILPILLSVLLLFKSRRLIVFVLVGVCLILECNRIWVVNWGEISESVLENIYLQTHFRADELCFGVILGWFSIFRKELFLKARRLKSYSALFFIAALIIPFFYPWGNKVMEEFGIPVMYLCFGAIVAISASAPNMDEESKSSIMRGLTKFLAYVGFYSYTIYLAQAFMFALPLTILDRLTFGFLGNGFGLQGLTFFLGSIIFGIVLSKLIEQPFLRLRERLVPKPVNKQTETLKV